MKKSELTQGFDVSHPQDGGPKSMLPGARLTPAYAQARGAGVDVRGVSAHTPDARSGDPVTPVAAQQRRSSNSPNLHLLDYEAVPTGDRLHAGRGLFRGLMGPIGSGKSVTCCQELFRLALAQRPHNGVRKTRWAIIRATYPELHSTTIKTWQDWFPPSICPLKMHDSPITGLMKLPLPDGTVLHMELVFVALEREEDTRKVLSMELTGVWFNEARELPFGIIRDAMGRIGRYPSKKEGGHTRKAALADTNPPDDDHWWYRLAEEQKLNDDSQEVTLADFEFFKQPGALIMTPTGYAPNPAAENIKNLSDGYGYYIDQLAGRDPEWIRVYILGEYGTIADGKPVYGRSYSDNLHCSSVPYLPIKQWPLILAFDFGRTPACAIMQQTPRGQVRVLEEIVTEDSDIRSLCRDILSPKLATTYRECKTIFVTGDPAGLQKSQTESVTCYDIIGQELGARISDMAPAETNDPTARKDSVRKLMSRLVDGIAGFSLSPTCRVLRKGYLGGYKFHIIRMTGGQQRVSESPVKNIYSHICEAVEYGCMYILGGIQASLSLATRKFAGASVQVADRVAGV